MRSVMSLFETNANPIEILTVRPDFILLMEQQIIIKDDLLDGVNCPDLLQYLRPSLH